MSLITTEIIKNQEQLRDLSDEQAKAVETLANNLFKKTIDETSGGWHRRLEEDVKTVFGKEKPEPLMKSYDFLKWAKAEYDKEIEAKMKETGGKGTGEEIEKAHREIERLKNELKDAGLKGSELLKQDIEGYKKRISDLESHAEDLKKQMTQHRKELESKVQEKERQNLLLEVGFERAQSLTGVEFDPMTPEDVRKTFIESKWSQLLSQYTPEKVTNERGEQVTQWRDKAGKLVYDETNLSELATTKNLLLKELKPILKQGRQQAGAGTNGGHAGGGATVDLRAARTQVDADEAISQALMAQGLKRGTVEFAQKQAEIRKENGVEKLPMV